MTYYVVETESGWDVRKEHADADSFSNFSSKGAAINAAKGLIGNRSGNICVRNWNGFEKWISVNK